MTVKGAAPTKLVTITYTVNGKQKKFQAQEGVSINGYGTTTKSQPNVNTTASKNINLGLISSEQEAILTNVRNFDGKPALTEADTKQIYNEYCKKNGGEHKAFGKYGETEGKKTSIFGNPNLKVTNSFPIPGFEPHQVMVDYTKGKNSVTGIHIDFDPKRYEGWD